VRFNEVLRFLELRYGPRRRGRTRRCLDELMLLLLGKELGEEPGRGPSAAARRALESLNRNFVDWNHVRVARRYEVARVIHASRGRKKVSPDGTEYTSAADRVAKRIRAALQQIHTAHGILDLEGYTGVRPVEIRRFLDRVPAIDREDFGRILLYVFRAGVMPVDGRILAVLQRTGLVPGGTTRPRAARLLQENLDQGHFYAAYRLLSEHADRICTKEQPACRDCVLKNVCPSARKFLK